MARISVNLLSPETMAAEIKKARVYNIQIIGVIVILAIVFLISLTVALRILQSRNIAKIQAQIDQTIERISELKNTQAALLLLKDRLRVIAGYWGISSQQVSMYQLVDKLIPPAIVVNAISISKTGEALLLVVASDSTSIDNLIINLTTKESNQGKISQVAVDSLNRGRDSLYKISFKIKP